MEEMLARMSAREFASWRIFDAQSPIGDRRADLQAGVVAAAVANVFSDPDKRSKPYTPEDFALSFERVTVADQQEANRTKMRALMGMFSRRKEAAS